MGIAVAAVLLAGCGSSKDAGQADTTAQETSAAEEKETTSAAESTAAAGGTAAAPEASASGGAEASGETTVSGGTAAAGEATSAAGSAEAGTSTARAIYDKITEEVELNAPMIVPDDFISNYYGIDVSGLDDYLFSMSEAAISAETVAIVKTNADNKEEIRDALQKIIDDKSVEMENYLPDQFEIVSKSSVKEAGDYVYLVISENADTINGIIEAALQ